jgi:hypothetical protein
MINRSTPSVPDSSSSKKNFRNRKRLAEPKEDSDSKKGKEGNLADKYKYVRFVEKKKVLRRMRQLQQKLSVDAGPNRDSIESELSELRKDLMYVEKFPNNQKYISLFPSTELSTDCLKKQNEIRSMIVNLTRRNEEGNTGRKLDVIQSDDFFASVDNVEKKPKNPEPETKRKSLPGTVRSDVKKSKPSVHPSWEAKKTNEKITGSITGQTFTGNRVIFDEEE